MEVIPSRIWTAAQTFRFLLIVKWLGLVIIAGMIANLYQRGTGDLNKTDSYLLLAGLASPITTGLTHVLTLVRIKAIEVRTVQAILGFLPVLAAVVIVVGTTSGWRLFAIEGYLGLFIFVPAALVFVHGRSRRTNWALIVGISLLVPLALYAAHEVRPSSRELEKRLNIDLQITADTEVLAQIHRRDDYAAAERAIGAREGDGPGTIWGRGGPVSVFSCRGETL